MGGRLDATRRVLDGWRTRRAEVRAARRNRADGTRCFYCDAGFEAGGRRQRTIDHRIPRSQGGADGLANMVFACAACNLEKADGPEVDFLASDWLRDRKATIIAERLAQGPR